MKKFLLTCFALVSVLSTNAQTSSVNGYYKGDINGDGAVDIQDMALLINVLNGKATATARCKLNADNSVDLSDLEILKSIVVGKTRKTWVGSIDYGGSNYNDDAPLVVEGKERTAPDTSDEVKESK